MYLDIILLVRLVITLACTFFFWAVGRSFLDATGGGNVLSDIFKKKQRLPEKEECRVEDIRSSPSVGNLVKTRFSCAKVVLFVIVIALTYYEILNLLGIVGASIAGGLLLGFFFAITQTLITYQMECYERNE